MRKLTISALMLSTLLALVATASGQTTDTLADLQSPDARVRAMAACTLSRGRAGDVRPAKDTLLAMLGDGTPVEGELCREWGNWRNGKRQPSSPGREAAIALEELGTEVLSDLVAVLGTGSAIARENAALGLGLIESEAAIEPLTAALSDSVAPVRTRAAWGLGMIESASAVPALARAVDDSAAAVREQVAWALGMIEASSGVEALARLLRDTDAAVREQAAWGMGMVEDRRGTAALLPVLQDADAGVREQAAWALGMIEDASAANALADALERETEKGVRKQLVWALTRVIDGGDLSMEPSELAALLRRALLRRDG